MLPCNPEEDDDQPGNSFITPTPKEAPMLRASVSISRKISRDYNSAGYTVTLDGEVPHPPDDAEAVLEKVSALFHLAEEALATEIERDQRHLPEQTEAAPPPPPPVKSSRAEPLPMNRPASSNGSTPSLNTATPKQLQFLQNLGKRKGLSRDDLDGVIAQVLGSAKRTGDLSKREAGQVIHHLTHLQPEESR
jgi:hypothetical protein